MPVSKIKIVFLLFCLLSVVLSFNFFIVSGQNNNSVNGANVPDSNANTNVGSIQTNSTKETTDKEDTGDKSKKNVPMPSPTPCDQDVNLTVSQVYKDVKVTDAYQHKDNNLLNEAPNEKTKTIELGDTIVVEVENLELLLNRKECLANEGNSKELVLFLDNRPLKNTTENPPVDPATERMHFTLVRNADTKDVWTYLLEMPRWETSKTKVSVGLEDTFAIDSEDAAHINLIVIPHGWSIFWLVVIFIFIIGFLYLASVSSIIRNPGNVSNNVNEMPFSLAKTQAAWWFFIILASYLFIGVITGDFNTTITTTVLGLFGISAGTAVGSAVLNSSKNTETNRQKKLNEADSLEAEAQNVTATAESQMSLQEQEEKEAKTEKVKKLRGITTGFITDILTDKDGISFHRFQAAALSIVLGFIFIYQVYATLAMPEFSGTLLTLLLISSGTYLGFKLPQK